MTVSEAKALAERGDTGAMMALAEYYSKEEGGTTMNLLQTRERRMLL